MTSAEAKPAPAEENSLRKDSVSTPSYTFSNWRQSEGRLFDDFDGGIEAISFLTVALQLNQARA